MCKIILKFGDPFTVKEIEGHRERVEKGAGFLWKAGDHFRIAKNMVHQVAYDGYIKQVGKTPFHLFHSRYPSEGSINFQNIQPFASEEFAFCHNGTMALQPLLYACMGARVKFGADDSDSLLLFKLLKNLNRSGAVAVLKNADQNFIAFFKKFKEIHIFGRWQYEVTESEDQILSARNMWGQPYRHVITNFDGKVLYTETRPERVRWGYTKTNAIEELNKALEK